MVKRDYDFYLKDTLYQPRDVFPNEDIYEFCMQLKERFYKYKIKRKRMWVLAETIKADFGIEYKIVGDNHIVWLPRVSEFVEKEALTGEPELLSSYANRGSGKTVMSWTLGVVFIQEYHQDGEIYCYGDIDGMGEAIKHEYDEFSQKIHLRKDYSNTPPADDTPKFAIYNEPSKETMGKRAMTNENVDLNLQAFRSRHKNTWVCYNNIDFSSQEGVLKRTTNVAFYKWMSPKLLMSAMRGVNKEYQELIKMAAKFDVNDALVDMPLRGRGNFIGIYETNPPDRVLEADRKASKNYGYFEGEHHEKDDLYGLKQQQKNEVAIVHTAKRLIMRADDDEDDKFFRNDKGTICRTYYNNEEKFSLTKLSEVYKVNKNTVSFYLKKHGIKDLFIGNNLTDLEKPDGSLTLTA